MGRLQFLGRLRSFSFRSFLALTTLAIIGVWWKMDQPRRKNKAVFGDPKPRWLRPASA